MSALEPQAYLDGISWAAWKAKARLSEANQAIDTALYALDRLNHRPHYNTPAHDELVELRAALGKLSARVDGVLSRYDALPVKLPSFLMEAAE